MNLSLQMVGVALALICGCKRQSATPAGPVVGGQQRFPSVAIRDPTFLEHAAAGTKRNTAEASKFRWEVTILQFPEEAIELHGLANLFNGGVRTNDVIAGETDVNPLVRMARADSNIVLNLRSAGFAGACDRAAATNLVTYLKQAPGTEVLSLPNVVTVGGDQGRVSSVNSITVFTGASSNSNPRTPFMTNLWFGHTVNVRLLSGGAEAITVKVSGLDERFGGYVRDEVDPTSQYAIGNPPIFDVSILGTRTELKTNEVLLLGSQTGASVRTSIKRVPVLSDIPVLRRAFTKIRKETNYFRQVIVVAPIRQ